MPLTIDQRKERQRLAAQRYREAHPDRMRLASQRWRKAHPDRHTAGKRAYYAAHRDELLAARKAYYAAHKDEEATRNRLWREANPEYQRLWHETHKESIRIRVRAYALANPAVGHASAVRHRARKLAAPSTFTAAQWKAIVAAYKGKCAYCGAKSRKLTMDHVIPLARGGHHTAENVVPACMSCNQHKSAGLPPLVPALRLLL